MFILTRPRLLYSKALRVLTTRPVNQQTDVDVLTDVEVVFNADINPSSVTEFSFILETVEEQLKVLSTVPKDKEVDIPLSSHVVMNFDADIDPDSVDSDTLLIAYTEEEFDNIREFVQWLKRPEAKAKIKEILRRK